MPWLFSEKRRKCLVQKGGHKKAPLGRALKRPEEPSRLRGAAAERLGTAGAYHIRSARVLLKLLLKKRRTWSTWNTWTRSGQGTYPVRPS